MTERRNDSVVPKLPAPFVDGRGSIQNLFEASEDEEPARGVAVIRSVKGSVRSNHRHKTDWHYLHVLTGSMRYLERDISSGRITEFTVSAGETVFTPPLVDHRTEFLEDTVMVSISRLSRKHQEHESDLVRVEWPDEA